MPPLETITDLAPRLRRKEVSPLELARTCLDRIERLNPSLNAFITVTAESALAEARATEKEISRGEWRGPLHGIPVALKDLIDTAGTRTTAASALYQNRVPAEDAEVVRRLREGRCRDPRQKQSARVRIWRQFAGQLLRRRPQPVEYVTYRRRLVGRISRRCGRRTLLCGDWNRHGWLHSPAGRPLRLRRDQAHLWPRFDARRDSAFLVTRSRRTIGRDCRRCRAGAASDRGIRSARLSQC